MTHLNIVKSPVEFDPANFSLKGAPVVFLQRTLADLTDIFLDHQAAKQIDPQTPVYTVHSWLPVKEWTEGGLFFGTSTLMPGKVGNEYFMTKGHFHELADRSEFYWGIQGKGVLILMDRDRNTWGEEVYPGSLHYIGSEIAHRLANTGEENLVVGACWPSDAGHNYEDIAINGFSARLMDINGTPVLVAH
jgi:glucose-6-phosphate isomerase, archaeal